MASAGNYTYTVKLNDLLSPKMAKIARNTQKATGRMMGSIKKFDKSVSRSLSGVRGLVGAAAAGAVFKFGFEAAADLEKNRLIIQTMVGDVEKGNKVFEELTKFSDVTPFQPQEVQKAGKALMAFGVEAKDLTSTLKLIGDVSAGTDKPIQEMAVIFGQIKSVGKLTGERLNQLSESGFNPLMVISEKTGESMESLQAKMRKGEITFDMVKDAFRTATTDGGKFNDMMKKLSETQSGKWSTFIGQFKTQVGEIFLAFKPLTKKIMDKLIQLTTWVKNNQKLVIKWVKWIGIAVAVIGSLILVMKVVLAIQALIAATNPFTLIALAVIALIALITAAIVKFKEWGETFLSLLGPIGKVIIFIKKLYDSWEWVKKGFTDGGFIEGMKRIAMIFLDTWLSTIETILKGFVKLTGAGKGTLKTLQNFRKKLRAPEPKKTTTKKKEYVGLPSDGGRAISDEHMQDLNKRFNLDRFKGKKNVNPAAKAAEKKAGGIINGGKKQTNISITLDQLVENLNINSADTSEGADTMEQNVTSALLRVLNSANSIA